MTTDIVTRLRAQRAPWVCVREEAASEIEMLRKELKLAQWRFERIGTGEHDGDARGYAEAIAVEMMKWK